MDPIFTAQLDGEVDLGIAVFVLSLEVHVRGKVDALRDLFLLASTLVMSIGPVFRTAIPRIEINYLTRLQTFVSSPVSMGKEALFVQISVDFLKCLGLVPGSPGISKIANVSGGKPISGPGTGPGTSRDLWSVVKSNKL